MIARSRTRHDHALRAPVLERSSCRRGMGSRTAALLVVLLLAGAATRAHGGVLGRGFHSALGGATLGHLVDGQDGARTGAAIGGAVGLIRGASESSKLKQQEEARARQEAERKRADEEQRRLAAQQQPASARPVPSAPADPALVTEIQKSLVRLGFDPGDINGQMQPATEEAIRQYQAAHDLLTDGHPSQELLKHLLRNGG